MHMTRKKISSHANIGFHQLSAVYTPRSNIFSWLFPDHHTRESDLLWETARLLLYFWFWAFVFLDCPIFPFIYTVAWKGFWNPVANTIPLSNTFTCQWKTMTLTQSKPVSCGHGPASYLFFPNKPWKMGLKLWVPMWWHDVSSPPCVFSRHSASSADEMGFNDPSLLENLQSDHVSITIQVWAACIKSTHQIYFGLVDRTCPHKAGS